MKRFTIFLLILLMSATAFSAIGPSKMYKRTDGNFSLLFAGTSAARDAVPSGVWVKRDGDFWYDTAGNQWYTYDSAAWNAFSGGGGTTLQGAYDYGGLGVGRAITSNTGAVTITKNDTGTENVLELSASPSGSADGDGLLITNGSNSTGVGLQFANSGSGNDIAGTSDTWTVSAAGAAVFTTLAPTGVTTFVTDVTFDATDAGKDVEWDDSRETLHFLDDAILGLGGATTAVADITFTHNGTNLLIEGATQDNTPIHFGSTNAFDILFYDNAATGTATFNSGEATLSFNAYDLQLQDGDLAMFGDDDVFTLTYGSSGVLTWATLLKNRIAIINYCADTDGIDLKLFGITTGAFAQWDATLDMLEFDGATSLHMGQASDIEFSDDADGNVDWTVSLVTDEILTFIPSEIDGTSSYNIGDVTNTSDVRIFGETASTVVFDATADEVLFNAYDIGMQDGDFINWGDSDDFTMTATNQAFTFQTLTTDETSAWNFGADQDGSDLKLFGATTGSYFLWDADVDAVLIDKADIAFSESDGLLFGDTLGTGDIRLDSTVALFTIGQVAAGTGSVAVGVDDAGLDWTFFGDTTLVNMKWTTASGLLAFTGQVNVATFEGTTVDGVDTILAVTDPTTGNQVWTLPDLAAADTVAVMASTLATNAPEVANSVTGGTNQLIFEGATGGDGFQTIVTPVDATADRTVTIPDKTGTVLMASAASVITPSTTPTLTVGLSNIYTNTPNDNEDQTITFSGAGTSGDMITIVFATTAAGDEVITFHATLVSSSGTLTIGTTASRFMVITFISNGSHWYEISRSAELT